MGKKTGVVLVGLGVFFLALAALSRYYVYDRLAVVPLDYVRTSVSEGTGATVFDIANQEEVSTDLVSRRKVVGEVEAAETAADERGRDIAIWETVVITNPPGRAVDGESPPLAGSHDRVAFDRHTGEVLDCCGNYLSSTANLETGSEVRDTATPIEGQYFKLPFDAQKETYQFWDGTLKEAADLEYRATEEIQGLTVYKYEQAVPPTTVGTITAPASYFGIDADGDVEIDRVYSNTRTLWVEPETGVIIRGQEAQNTVAEYQGEQVATLTDVVIGYNGETIQANIDDYEPLASQLKLVRVWVPLIGLAAGLVLLIAGLALVARPRSGRRAVR
jgi:Porin PorA